MSIRPLVHGLLSVDVQHTRQSAVKYIECGCEPGRRCRRRLGECTGAGGTPLCQLLKFLLEKKLQYQIRLHLLSNHIYDFRVRQFALVSFRLQSVMSSSHCGLPVTDLPSILPNIIILTIGRTPPLRPLTRRLQAFCLIASTINIFLTEFLMWI